MKLIMEQLGKVMVPILIELAIDNMDAIHEFLSEKARMTDNKLDDYIVDVLCEFLEDFLQDNKDG